MPSKVEVPRPISSRTIRLRGVAWLRMLAVSVISTMKVDWPRARLSLAPTRVKIRSTTPMRAALAGTRLPIWAISTISATWRMKVDLPAMLGPVMTRIWLSRVSMTTSLGTKRSPRFIASITGWRPSSMSRSVDIVHLRYAVIAVVGQVRQPGQHVEIRPGHRRSPECARRAPPPGAGPPGTGRTRSRPRVPRHRAPSPHTP